MTLGANLDQQISSLEALGLEALRAQWREGWGPVPRLRSPDLLRRMIAWRLQAAAFGDLDADTRRSLRRQRAPVRQGLRLSPGTRLTREWKGGACEVEVVEGGFRYAGETYRSLTKIAAVITGGKWNGPRFFGVSREVGK